MPASASRVAPRVRIVFACTLAAALFVLYLALPDGDDGDAVEAVERGADAGGAQRLEIVGVSPAAPSVGSALVIRYVGALPDVRVRVVLGKRDLRVLARRPSSIIAQLPAGVAAGHVKLRITSGSERSKPYDLRVKAVNWRKPFRNLIGGIALFALGISIFTRGARGITAWQNARTLARLAARPFTVLFGGGLVGATMPSTLAAAALLAGLVGAGVLAVLPAAIAFLGAQLGAAVTPLLLAGLVEPREGLLAVAVGVLWLGLAPDRRSAAFARLVLGAGLVMFGLQLLRPGIEPFVSNPELLSFAEQLGANGVLARVGAALLGAALVAVFQGPSPLLVLVLFIAEATGRHDLRGMLALLSGASLGAALGALLTTPASPRCRRLAELNLAAALVASGLAVISVDGFAALADRLVGASDYQVRWGKHALIAGTSWRLAVAFALSQSCVTLCALALLPRLERALARMRPDADAAPPAPARTAASFLRADLLRALETQCGALAPIAELALRGSREAGRSAEHALGAARELVRGLLAHELPRLASDEPSRALGRVAFAALQLQRALEDVLRRAEQLTDNRIASALGRADASELAADDQAVLGELHVLLGAGMQSLRAWFDPQNSPPELEDAYTREIQINQLEARARNALLSALEPDTVRDRLAVLELVDAYEAAGNQVFRVAVALAGTHNLTDSQLAISA